MSEAPTASGATGQNASKNGASYSETWLMAIRYAPSGGTFSSPDIRTRLSKLKKPRKTGRKADLNSLVR
jgi:hypothetical protein